MEDDLPSRRQERALSSGTKKKKKPAEQDSAVPGDKGEASEKRVVDNPEEAYIDSKDRTDDSENGMEEIHDNAKEVSNEEDSPPDNSSSSEEIKHMELLALNCSVDPGGWLEGQKAQNQVTGIIFYYGDW